MSNKTQVLVSEKDYIWKDLCRSNNFEHQKTTFNSWSIFSGFRELYEDQTDRIFKISFPKSCNIDPVIAELHITSGREIHFSGKNKGLRALCEQLAKEMGLEFHLFFQAMDIGEHEWDDHFITPPTTVETVVKRRTQQAKYRSDLLKLWDGKCAVTEIDFDGLLVSSHIKRFADSDENEAYNPANGLLLCTHVDKLFDQGYISFDENGEMLVSSELDTSLLKKLGIQTNSSIKFKNLKNKKLKKEILQFLVFHRENTFKK